MSKKKRHYRTRPHTCGVCQEYRRLDNELRAAFRCRAATLTEEAFQENIQRTYLLWTTPHVRRYQRRPYFCTLSESLSVPLPDEVRSLFRKHSSKRKGTGDYGHRNDETAY